jgi:Uma2 family endonuclease
MTVAQEELVLGPGLAGTQMTPEEFDAAVAVDEMYTYELVNGVLVVMPPPDIGERSSNDHLGYLLRSYREHHRHGKSLDHTTTEHLIETGANRRRTDRAIWAGLGRLPNVDRDAPTIAVEYVSRDKRDRKRDYETKRDEYRAAKIKEYWIIDRFRRLMTVHRLAGETIVVTEGAVYTTPLLAGFELAIAALFAEADALNAARENGNES